MPQTPKSVSVPLAGAAATAYTVPGGATAVLKTALGQNVVGGSSTFTIQKLASGVYSPLIINQQPNITPATGGTAFASKNLIDGPVTLTAGDSVVVSDSATPQWKFPRTSAFSSSIVNSYIPRNMLFANGVYILVAQDNTNVSSLVQRSTDGITWTEIATGNSLGTSNAYYMANFGNNWVIGRWNTIDYMYSTDNGLTWTAATLPSGALIVTLSSNSSTFAFCTANGVYTSTSLPTWTLNTALNNLINISFSSSGNREWIPQIASWDGTYWFISNSIGTWYTTNFSTYKSLYAPLGGANFPSGFFGIRWSSTYSRYYAIGKSHLNAQDVVSSSTNGFDWTPTSIGTNQFNNTQGRVNMAGSNTVLIAKTNQSNLNVLKSTDGTSWSAATIVRANFFNMMEGLSNGQFITCNDSSAQWFMSTDPTTSTGTLMSTGVAGPGFNAAASDGTGWVLTMTSGSTGNFHCAYGTGPTTLTNANVLVDTSGEQCYSLVWWPARSLYVGLGTSGSIYTTTNGASWTIVSKNIGGSQTLNASMQVIGNFLYVVNSSTGSNIWRTSVADSATSTWTFTQISINTFAYSTYADGYYTSNYVGPERYQSGAMASNGTDIVFSNYQGNSWIYTPSFGPFIRTPGAGGLIVERTNNLDIVYTSRIFNTANNTNGFFYGSDVVASLPTNSTFVGSNFSSTMDNSPTTGNPLLCGRKVLFYGGAYYAVPDSNSISYATNIRSFTNYTWSSTSVGLVPVVIATTGAYAQNRIQSDGTNFISYTSQSSGQGIYISTSPSSSLASSSLTLGLIEIT